MNITDELRSWAEGDALRAGMSLRTARDQALAIADRIDAEYKEVLGYKVTRAISVREDGTEFVSMPAKELSERYMELPLDIDGVPVHIGDMMEYVDAGLPPKEVIAISGPEVFLTDTGPRYADACRHYHAPTVEDMMVEFATDWESAQDGEDKMTVLKEYAAKFRLVEEEK